MGFSRFPWNLGLCCVGGVIVWKMLNVWLDHDEEDYDREKRRLLFNLGHFSGPPVNFSRVPDHLRIQIIEKVIPSFNSRWIVSFQQSTRTIFTLPYTNSRYCVLVEAALSRNPHAMKIQQVLKEYDKVRYSAHVGIYIQKELIETADISQLFPPSKYLGPINCWISAVHINMLCFLRQEPIGPLVGKLLFQIKPLKYVKYVFGTKNGSTFIILLHILSLICSLQHLSH